MATKKISEMDVGSALTGAEKVPMAQVGQADTVYANPNMIRGYTLNGGSLAVSNLIIEPLINMVKPSDAISVTGGTTANPHSVGYKYKRELFDGDAVTTDFTVNAGFTVNDIVRNNVRVNTSRKSDGLLVDFLEGAGFSVLSGYGTSSITVRLDSAPASGSEVEITIFSEDIDPSSVSTLAQLSGYDNSVNAIMSIAYTAHGMILNGNGHNSIIGGSFHRAGGSYNAIIGGKYNRVGTIDSSSFACFTAGTANRVDGAFCSATGGNNTVNGDSSHVSGVNCDIQGFNNVNLFGSNGKALDDGETVRSGTPISSSVKGLYQCRDIILHANTSSVTETAMTNSAIGSNFATPENSTSIVSLKVSAVKSDGAKSESFSGDFHLSSDASGVTLINGLASDVNVTSLGSVGSPLYNCDIRAISGGFIVRVTGGAGESVRWVGVASITQTFHE